ncbi:hypothetical protein AVANI_34 [Mycobacterium phage Avani]|uniref:Uncharacterized protein n=2 Tax=Avanivirus TaxID=2843352 RepID=Q855S9_9CAUD|nr:hypothetical protein PBI_CHE9D_34 [Mycobacterium phage Che9d]YP_009013129.1 hypothetical protein CL78_gp034 [Mycobacterium phage Avani]AAN07952.1 hypothetical protein PBI_CHE9D_34 [Mycobacterium phage Che9d]AFL47948.1 hypothetical protein AVANI_34 [Mycobacterium phage Avani]
MGILNKIIDFDPIIKTAVEAAATAVETRVKALLPLIAAAAAKALADEIAQRIPNVPVVGDVLEVAEKVRTDLNNIPDIDIPGLSDIFDLTEWLKGRR